MGALSVQTAARRRVRSRFHHHVLAMSALLGATALVPAGAFAACSPATGNNVAVTCSGATLNQGPEVNTGYGSGLQNGLTITVQSAASVAGTSIGIDVSNNNTIINLGTITTAGNDVFGIQGGASLTVVNSGTIGRPNDVANNIFDAAGIFAQDTNLIVTNNAGATIQGGNAAIQGVGSGMVVNSGLITSIGFSGTGIDFSANSTSQVEVINKAGGVINGDSFGINAAIAIVFNSGTIAAPTAGSAGTGINANNLVLVNFASGLITGDGFGVSGGQNPNLTITNFGAITVTGPGGFVISGNTVNVVNSGTISSAFGSGGTGIEISAGGGSVVNNAGGLIASDVGIVVQGLAPIFNAGTITAGSATGFAIEYFQGGNTLTIAPTSNIIGKVGFGVGATGANTFQLGGGGIGTFDVGLIGTQYLSFATFNKVDASTWILTGTNAAAMPWSVNGGTLDVNGTVANATFTVNSGATLGGTGVVGATTVKSGGTLAPGNGTPGSALTVNGSLAFQSGALYLVQLNSATASLVNVTGTAALAGTIEVAATSFRFNSPYTLLTSSGLGGSRFDALSLGLPTGITATLSYSNTSVFLDLTSTLGQLPGLNGNQAAVAHAIDTALNAGGVSGGAFGALFNGNVAQNLTQASGEAATGAQQTTFEAMNLFMGLLTDPSARDGGVAPSGGVTPFAEEGASAATARSAFASLYAKAPPAEVFAARWSVWAAGFGGAQSADGNAVLGTNSVTSRIAGTAAGADYRLAPSTLVGFALAGGGTSFSLANALGQGHSDLFQAAAYLRHTEGAAYLAAALAYGWQDVTTDRTVTIAGLDRLHAEFNANAWSGRLEGGYRFAQPWFGGIGLTPYAAAQFVTFELPAYAEAAASGANTFALSYSAKTVTDPRSELGFRDDVSTALGGGVLTLRGRLAWAHDFNTNRNIAAVFQTLPGAAFVVNGAAQARDAALSTASAEMKWTGGWSLAATVESEYSSAVRSYAGKGVARYSW